MQEADGHIITAITTLAKENVEVLGDMRRSAADGESKIPLPAVSYIPLYLHCLGCAVLLCLVICLTLLASFFLPSRLSLKHAYIQFLFSSLPLHLS